MSRKKRQSFKHKIVDLAVEGKYTQKEIAERVGETAATVCTTMLEYEIMSVERIKRLIRKNPNMSDLEIANITNVKLDGVRRLMSEVEATEKPRKDRNNRIIELYKTGRYTVVQLAKMAGIVPSTARDILIKNGIDIKTAKKRRNNGSSEENFRARRKDLLEIIKGDKSEIDEFDENLIEFEAGNLLENFAKFLETESDYAFIAYSYIVAKRPQKAIEIGKEYLGLEDPTAEDLEKRINQIMSEKEIDRKEDEAKTKSCEELCR